MRAKTGQSLTEAFHSAVEFGPDEQAILGGIVIPASTPEHYAGSVTPWDLERCMKTSGNVFVDARRTDAIEYCFRIKEDLIGDLKKAKHCIEEAIKELEK